MSTININLPGPWPHLTDDQLRYTFRLLADGYSSVELKTLFFLHFGHLKMKGRIGSTFILARGKERFNLSAKQIAECLSVLDWLDSTPSYPTRLMKVDHHHALPADFQGVSFEKFLFLDNLYQGYLHTQNEKILNQLATILYSSKHIRLSKAERISIFYWFVSLKNHFARTFHTFFQPSTPNKDMSMKSIRDSLMSQ